VDLVRPEIIRHRKRLSERYEQPEDAEVLILLPSLSPRLTVKKKKYKRIIAKLCEELKISRDRIHVCFYVLPFGIVPQEISDIYPLSQYEFALPPDAETIEYVAQRIIEYVEKSRYKKIVMIWEPGTWQERVSEICAEKVMKKMEFLRA